MEQNVQLYCLLADGDLGNIEYCAYFNNNYGMQIFKVFIFI